MKRWVWGLVLTVIWAATAAGLASGSFQTIDHALRDLRFAAEDRPATGQVVFIDIDAGSLKEVGVWPWPRGVHARLLDTLLEAGADEVSFDIDFSTISNPADDQVFEEALERAGGYARLAAFGQGHGTGGTIVENLPLERFRRHAGIAAVNVNVDEKGLVRLASGASRLGGEWVPSLAAVLAGVDGVAGSSFEIDYSIDPLTVPRLSVADVLEGTYERDALVGKRAVVGASALELRDIFMVPHRGLLPGALVQAIAAESILQGRTLVPLPLSLPLSLALLIGASSLLIPRGLKWRGITILVIAVAVEALALVLQLRFGLLLDTACLHLAQAALLIAMALSELSRRRRLQLSAARARDASERTLNRVIADNFDGVLVIDAWYRVQAASRLAEQFFGSGLTGRPALEFLPTELGVALAAALRGEQTAAKISSMEIALGEGRQRVIEYSITMSLLEAESATGEQRVLCLTFRDVTEKRRAEARLEYLSLHDPLTGALSRHAFLARLGELAGQSGATLLLLDLSGFRSINDSLGHLVGDRVLQIVAERARVSGFQLVSRVGGDHFALGCAGAFAPERVAALAERLLLIVAQPMSIGEHRPVVRGQIGATTSDRSGTDPATMLQHADMALSATRRGRHADVALFTTEMSDRLASNLSLEGALRSALEEGRLVPYFQGQYDLLSSALVGAEALARWPLPGGRFVAPDRFIKLAEETGLIVQLGAGILEAACMAAARWPGRLRLSVNVSPQQFQFDDLYGRVDDIIGRSGLDPARLDLEITESMLMDPSRRVLDVLGRLRSRGIGIAIDDFGTGFSSLSTIANLPIDKIKVDQSFVKRIPAEADAVAVIETVLALAAKLRKQVVAEGVETAAQARLLAALGCPVGQGFHFARPLSASHFAAAARRAELSLAS